MRNILLTLLVTLSISSITMADDKKEIPPYRVYEMRTYHAHDGKLEDLHKRFRDHTLKIFEKSGMVNVVYLSPNEKDNTFTYLLAYHGRAHAQIAWRTFLDDPDWKAAYKASIADGKLVKKIDKVFYEPTDYSPAFPAAMAKKAGDAKTPRLFELRTYDTRDGKLKNLDARFRDHTCALFEKHGMENILYMHPMSDQETHGKQLVYLIAHKDMASRDASFDAFRKDADWVAARKASEKDGKILEKGGVAHAFFKATDYSPMK